MLNAGGQLVEPGFWISKSRIFINVTNRLWTGAKPCRGPPRSWPHGCVWSHASPTACFVTVIPDQVTARFSRSRVDAIAPKSSEDLRPRQGPQRTRFYGVFGGALLYLRTRERLRDSALRVAL